MTQCEFAESESEDTEVKLVVTTRTDSSNAIKSDTKSKVNKV